ncbi:MAG: hypothetical protein Phyf2KO_25200 [Phycisphaerales bacterium]
MVGGAPGLYDRGMNRLSTLASLASALLIAMLLSFAPACTAQLGPAQQPDELDPTGEPPPENFQKPENTVDWGPRKGIWRGEIELPEAKVLSFNFVVRFRRDDQKEPIWDIWLRNGVETLPATLINNNPSYTITFPNTEARIEATINNSNTGLGGEYIYTRANSEGENVEYRLPFSAQVSDTRRFEWVEQQDANEDEEPAELAERWSVTFDKRKGPAVAELHTLPDGINVYGTVMTPTGDDGHLAGTFQNGRLRLSRFTGGSGLLYDGTLEADGTLIGTFRSLAHHAEGFTASPDGEAALPNLFELTKWNDGIELADLSFRDTQGQEVNLSEIAPQGSPRLIYVMGTWCHNCADATRYLTSVYEQYKEEGLEIVGLAFESPKKFEEQARSVEKYIDSKDVPFEILVAGNRDKAEATKILGALDKVAAYPTVVFVDASGRIAGVHQGFVGPAAPTRHAQLRREFTERIESMLAGQ